MEENDSDLEKEVRAIYTPLSVAKEEIWRRWNDKALRKKVEDFLGGDVPEPVVSNPISVLARHVASPNLDLSRFIDLSKIMQLVPVCFEYLADKFSTKNFNKYYLGKLFFYDGLGKKGGSKVSALKIIDFDSAQGEKICDIKTIWNESFVDFHHRMNSMDSICSNVEIFDISSWYGRNGKIPKNYYIKFFALFICHGVLLENFLFNNKEVEFTREIILPNYKKIMKIFGVKPLIVQLDPEEDENQLCSMFYPMRLKEKIKKLTKK
jgi:hypothetical protein